MQVVYSTCTLWGTGAYMAHLDPFSSLPAISPIPKFPEMQILNLLPLRGVLTPESEPRAEAPEREKAALQAQLKCSGTVGNIPPENR